MRCASGAARTPMIDVLDRKRPPLTPRDELWNDSEMTTIDRSPWGYALGALLALCAPACAQRDTPAAALAHALTPAGTLAVDAIENGGFEWIADSTTTPPKYGAYWVGAFVAAEGDATDLVADDVAWRGERSLELAAGSAVSQKLVADERWSATTVVRLAVRTGTNALDVALEDGPGERVTLRIGAGTSSWIDVETPAARITTATAPTRGAAGWQIVEIPIGAAFAAAHGRAPTPRLVLHLTAPGTNAAPVYVDDVVARVLWPTASRSDLLARARELVDWQLELWWQPRDEGGLGLVDPATGYVVTARYDVNIGATRPTERFGHLHTVHTLLVRWLHLAHEHGWDDEITRWTPYLDRFVHSLLENNFNRRTQLPRSVELADLSPRDDAPITVGSYVGFLVDAAGLVGNDALAARCRRQARATADALVWLAKVHDKPRAQKNALALDQATGVLEGDVVNWFGHMPPKLAPNGKIDQPRRFNSAWAIATGRPFWYHLLKTPAALARVHSIEPRRGDIEAIAKAVSLYERDWDAARYDLENDTDDHYGYHAEDIVTILEHVPPGSIPRAIESLHEATEHRLGRAGGSIDDMLWIQAIRLGTACAGDSPRAFQGVAAFRALDAERNPRSSDDALYQAAILELARNDLKGRQLTNGQFTESFFEHWEMVCICFRGTYQGDCREHPADYWHGDVGDTFGGPPTTGLEAQSLAFAVAPPARRQEFAAALALVDEVTQTTMRREYGMLFGLDEAIARQYELPEKYTIGVSDGEPAALAYAMSWLRCASDIASVPADLGRVRIERDDNDQLVVVGPAGAEVTLYAWGASTVAITRVADDDRRIMAGLPIGAKTQRVTLDATGRATIDGSALTRSVIIQPTLQDPDGGGILSIGPAMAL